MHMELRNDYAGQQSFPICFRGVFAASVRRPQKMSPATETPAFLWICCLDRIRFVYYNDRILTFKE